jgi:hypothetical protein
VVRRRRTCLPSRVLAGAVVELIGVLSDSVENIDS